MNSNGGSSGGSKTDIFNLIQEALKLAAAAVHFGEYIDKMMYMDIFPYFISPLFR